MKWKIYYEGSTEFSSEDGTPEEAPALGVLVITMEDRNDGRYSQCRSDYYIWRGENWLGVDIGGLYAYCLESDLVRYGNNFSKFVRTDEGWKEVDDIFDLFHALQRLGVVKFGQTVRTPDFISAIKRSDSDPFFAPRTAWKRDEYRLTDE